MVSCNNKKQPKSNMPPLHILHPMPNPNNMRPLLCSRSTHLLNPLCNPPGDKMLRRAPRQRFSQVLVDPVEGVTC